MEQSLTDFRIENDNLVLLSFANGRSYRVSKSDLDRHLCPADLAKIQEAMRVRQRFIKQVLPPTATVLLVLSIVTMGAYDLHRFSNRTQPSATHQNEQVKPSKTEQSKATTVTPPTPNAASDNQPPASMRPSSSTSTTPATSTPHSVNATGPSTTTVPQTFSAPSVPQVLQQPTSIVPEVVQPVTHQLLTPVQNVPIVQPVTQSVLPGSLR